MVIVYCPGHGNHIAHHHLWPLHMDRYSRNDHGSDVSRKALNVALIPASRRRLPKHLVTSAQTKIRRRNYSPGVKSPTIGRESRS
jgi:hypothetical protein